MVKGIVLILIGFGSGVVVAGGVFAFIAIIGLVPRLAQKSDTTKYVRLYEDAIILGGMFGALTMIVPMEFTISKLIVIAYGFFTGIFIGCMAVSLAEVLDVLPIISRRINLNVGMSLFLLSLAVGKLLGVLVYFLIPGFAEYK